MRRLLGLFRGEDDAPATLGPALPEALAVAIGAAQVTVRGVADIETGEPRISVICEGIGWWQWAGTADAAERIARQWPGISPEGARLAARLLARVVASRLQVSRPRDCGGFVFRDWPGGYPNVE